MRGWVIWPSHLAGAGEEQLVTTALSTVISTASLHTLLTSMNLEEKLNANM